MIEPSEYTVATATGLRLRHVVCVKCGKHVAATVFVAEGERVIDSWGGILFDSPGFICDCCITECPNCRGEGVV